mmetsp:Transcript_12071/g.22111  ORF Transcript_12071/g.22111 Transcript_12071/m.22111 type:complete len:203 (-) Transcript_12071:967-1575(-)
MELRHRLTSTTDAFLSTQAIGINKDVELTKGALRQFLAANQISHADVEPSTMSHCLLMFRWDGWLDPAIFALPFEHFSCHRLSGDAFPLQVRSAGTLLLPLFALAFVLALALAFALALALVVPPLSKLTAPAASVILPIFSVIVLPTSAVLAAPPDALVPPTFIFSSLVCFHLFNHLFNARLRLHWRRLRKWVQKACFLLLD